MKSLQQQRRSACCAFFASSQGTGNFRIFNRMTNYTLNTVETPEGTWHVSNHALERAYERMGLRNLCELREYMRRAVLVRISKVLPGYKLCRAYLIRLPGKAKDFLAIVSLSARPQAGVHSDTGDLPNLVTVLPEDYLLQKLGGPRALERHKQELGRKDAGDGEVTVVTTGEPAGHSDSFARRLAHATSVLGLDGGQRAFPRGWI